MRSRYDINGKPHTVDLVEEGSGQIEIVVNGRPFKVDFLSDRKNSRVLLIRKGRPHEILIKHNGRDEILFDINGYGDNARVNDEKDIKKLLRKKDSFGDKTITSLMPGKVVKVFVKEGDRVEKGRPLLIIEAMKMENELKAPKSGTIKSVNAKEGRSVEANSPLIVLV